MGFYCKKLHQTYHYFRKQQLENGNFSCRLYKFIMLKFYFYRMYAYNNTQRNLRIDCIKTKG